MEAAGVLLLGPVPNTLIRPGEEIPLLQLLCILCLAKR